MDEIECFCMPVRQETGIPISNSLLLFSPLTQTFCFLALLGCLYCLSLSQQWAHAMLFGLPNHSCSLPVSLRMLLSPLTHNGSTVHINCLCSFNEKSYFLLADRVGACSRIVMVIRTARIDFLLLSLSLQLLLLCSAEKDCALFAASLSPRCWV